MPSEHPPAEREPLSPTRIWTRPSRCAGAIRDRHLRAMFVAYAMLQEQAHKAVSAGYVRRRRERAHDGRAITRCLAS